MNKKITGSGIYNNESCIFILCQYFELHIKANVCLINVIIYCIFIGIPTHSHKKQAKHCSCSFVTYLLITYTIVCSNLPYSQTELHQLLLRPSERKQGIWRTVPEAQSTNPCKDILKNKEAKNVDLH